MDQGGHKGDISDSRTRDNKQCAPERYTQRLQHVDSEHSRGETGRQRTVHVPS